MPRQNPWTEQDLEDLQRLAEKRRNLHLDWAAIRKRFPNRSVHAIYKQLWANGWCQSRSWSTREDETLRQYWNDSSLSTLKKRLPGRTRPAIYERASKLGLRAGTPQGMVSVKSLSEEPSWGYDYYKTLKMMEAAGVRVRTFSYAGKKQGVRYVEIDEVRRAAEEWERKIADQRVGKETVKEAALRMHVRETTLREWLTLEGLMPPKDRKTKRKFWAAPDLYDRVAEKYRVSRPRRSESRQTAVR
jgi:hypothetical protein